MQLIFYVPMLANHPDERVRRPPQTGNRETVIGFDHGVGHSLQLLYGAKAPRCQKSNDFNALGHYLSNTPLSLSLQRHLIALLKFAPVESRFCSCKQGGKATFDTPINPCARSVCSRSVAVGLTLGVKSYDTTNPPSP